MDWLSYISQINWLAVLLAFIASMAIGFVWYLPAVLGTRWMEAIGKTEEELKNSEGGAGIWLPMMVYAALTAVLLAVLIARLGLDTAVAGFLPWCWPWYSAPEAMSSTTTLPGARGPSP